MLSERILRTHISSPGTFASVPKVFEGVDEGLVHGVKVGFVTQARPSTGAQDDGASDQRRFVADAWGLETFYSPDWLLLDGGAVRPEAFDMERVARDCDLVKQIVLEHPDELRRIIAAFQPLAPFSARKDAGELAKRIGFTEEDMLASGGGAIGLLLVVGLGLLASCAFDEGCNPTPPSNPPGS